MKKTFDLNKEKIKTTGLVLIISLVIWAVITHLVKKGTETFSKTLYKILIITIYPPIKIIESLPKTITEGPLSFATYIIIFLIYSYIITCIIYIIKEKTKK